MEYAFKIQIILNVNVATDIMDRYAKIVIC